MTWGHLPAGPGPPCRVPPDCGAAPTASPRPPVCGLVHGRACAVPSGRLPGSSFRARVQTRCRRPVDGAGRAAARRADTCPGMPWAQESQSQSPRPRVSPALSCCSIWPALGRSSATCVSSECDRRQALVPRVPRTWFIVCFKTSPSVLIF